MPHSLHYGGQDPTKPPNSLLVVEDARNITPLPNELQFKRGAAQQIAYLSQEEVALVDPSPFLVTSPYNLPGHLLDLHRLPNIQDRILALALTTLQPTRHDYATAPYEESLNWPEISQGIQHLSQLAQHNWTSQVYYVVTFRSQLKENYDSQSLWDLDRESHREAVESGGLLKYWFGRANEQRRNLATCIWRSKEDARVGGTGPWHQKARSAGGKLYDRISFSTWKLTIGDDALTWAFESWPH